MSLTLCQDPLQNVPDTFLCISIYFVIVRTSILLTQILSHSAEPPRSRCIVNLGAYLPWVVFTGSPLKLLRNVNKAGGPNAVHFSCWSCVGSTSKHNEHKLETQPGAACRRHRSSCVLTTRSSVCLGDLFLGGPGSSVNRLIDLL